LLALIFLAGLLAFGFGIAYLLRGEPTLLGQATRLTATQGWESTNSWHGNQPVYRWLSDHEVVFARREKTLPTCRFFRRDVRTGREASLAAVPAFAGLGAMSDPQISPDGRWLLFREPAGKPQRRYQRVAVTLDGSGRRVVWGRSEGERFPHLGRALWLPSSDGWLWLEHRFLAGRPASMKLVATRFLLADPEGAQTVELKGLPYGASKSAAGFLKDGRVLGLDTGTPGLLFTGFGSADFSVAPALNAVVAIVRPPGAAPAPAAPQPPELTLIAFDANGIAPPRRSKMRLPAGTVTGNVAVSPGGDRLAWIMETETYSPLAALARRFFPASGLAAQSPVRGIGLYVSRVDGADLRPLGFFALPRLALPKQVVLARGGNGANNPAAQAARLQQLQAVQFFDRRLRGNKDRPVALRWTPDGRRVSFVYKDALYAVPVPK